LAFAIATKLNGASYAPSAGSSVSLSDGSAVGSSETDSDAVGAGVAPSSSEELFIAKIARSTTPAMTRKKIPLGLFFWAAAGAGVGFAGEGVLVTVEVLRVGTGGITIFEASTFVEDFLAATLLAAAFLIGRLVDLVAAFLAGLRADFAADFFATFFTDFFADFLAALLAGRFAAAFLIGRLAEAFFFAATTSPSTCLTRVD
jgi:hypothetical protein